MRYLKHAIEAKCGLPSHEQHLTYGGHTFSDDDRCVSDYHLPTNATLTLHARGELRGGAVVPSAAQLREKWAWAVDIQQNVIPKRNKSRGRKTKFDTARLDCIRSRVLPGLQLGKLPTADDTRALSLDNDPKGDDKRFMEGT